jgi:hypothetical protein
MVLLPFKRSPEPWQVGQGTVLASVCEGVEYELFEFVWLGRLAGESESQLLTIAPNPYKPAIMKIRTRQPVPAPTSSVPDFGLADCGWLSFIN